MGGPLEGSIYEPEPGPGTHPVEPWRTMSPAEVEAYISSGMPPEGVNKKTRKQGDKETR